MTAGERRSSRRVSAGAALSLALCGASLATGVLLAQAAAAQQTDVVPFTLTVVDGNANGTLPSAQINGAHGCKGGNTPPQLLWSAPPAGTKSYAVTMLDQTARKGAGFWHWAVFDIPPGTETLAAKTVPPGVKSGRNDFGDAGYGGACPPAGDPAHTYAITVWALGDPTLKFDAGTPDAEIGAYLKAHALGNADLTFTYKR